jgi:FkbM family methyltransferase
VTLSQAQGIAKLARGALMARLTDFALRTSPLRSVQLFCMKERLRGESSLRVLDRFVRVGDVVVDIGAHRGVYTYRLAQLVGSTGHVHSFEPNPSSLRTLEAVRNGRANISIYRVALSDRSGEAMLHRPISDGVRIDAMSTVVVPHRHSALQFDSVRTRLVRLDDVFGPLHLTNLAFMKCDVEGHELEVLKGARGILDELRPVLLVEIEQRHQDRDIRATFDFVMGLGYAGYFLHRNQVRPINEFDLGRDQLAFLDKRFSPSRPHPNYVTDFLFLPSIGSRTMDPAA